MITIPNQNIIGNNVVGIAVFCIPTYRNKPPTNNI